MPQYEYRARDTKARKIKGKVEAKNKQVAASILREKGLFIISLRDHNESTISAINAQLSRVKPDDIVNFTRQLATMINAGLPLIQALNLLHSQSKPALEKIIRQMIQDIEGGSNLGDALAKHDVFSKVYVSLVQAGEAAGALDTILKRLADTLEKQKEFRAKTQGALIYPSIVMAAMGVVVIVMLVFVVPRMTELYADFDADLPFATQILIDLSDFLRNQWYVFAAMMVGIFVVFRAWKRSPQGALQFDEFKLRIPVMGKLRQKILVTEFSRTMSLMIAAGISLLEALDIVEKGMDNLVYQNAVAKARLGVEKGRPLSGSLQREDVFPALLPQMVSVGEETGQLDEVLQKLAAYYEAETEHAIKGLTTALEPMIMVVLGLGVGFLMIAIVMPIYNLTSQF